MKDLWREARIVQGDVYLIKIDKIPETANRVARHSRGYVLAEGEHTGHAHVISDGVSLFKNSEILFLEVPGVAGAILEHEEHKPITIPIGKYRVGRILEYDPFAEEARNVAD